MGADPNTMQGGVKFAGKYDGPEALEKGTVELATSMGLGPLVQGKLVGDNAPHKTHLDLEKFYTHLEGMRGKLSAKDAPEPKEPKEPKPQGGIKIEPQAAPIEDADLEAVLTKAGLKADELVESWKKDGKLGDAQYEALKKAGYSKTLVDTVMQGQKAAADLYETRQANIKTQAEAAMGGGEKLANLLAWAGQNIKGPRLEDMNRRLGSHDLFMGALTELQAEHAKSIGSSGSRQTINGSPGAPSGAIKDAAEFTKVRKAAEGGDNDALRRIMETPQSTIDGWINGR